MNKILAIAWISIRNAVRSRVVVVLLGILLLGIVGIPLTVKGDGTPGGYVQILVRYTLGFAGLLLALATVWAGCAAVSMEIQERQIHLIVTKPVRRLQIGLGKWLGLVALNAAALALCGAVTYGLLRWDTRPGRLTPAERQTLTDEVLVARQALVPVPADVANKAREQLRERQARGQMPANVPVETVYQAIREGLLTEAHLVPPGGKLPWTFPLPPTAPTDRPFQLRFKISSSVLTPLKIIGRWSIGREREARRYETTQEGNSVGVNSISVPAAALQGAGPLIVEYANVHPQPVTILFSPQESLTLLLYAGPWEGNLARALLVMLWRLAFIAALGVTAGSLFSLPVAAFAAFQALIVLSTSDFIRSMAARDVRVPVNPDLAARAPALLDAALTYFYRLVSSLIQPLETADPLALVATGQLLPWSTVAFGGLIQVGVYGGLLLLLGSWVLRRRELALPAG